MTTTKTQDTQEAQEAQERSFQEDFKDTAHRIWLAGLGALAAAEEEGSKLFSRLVDRGRDVEARGKVEVDKVVDRAKSEFDKAKTKAGSGWDEFGGKVDDAISGALHRLGVPTREEIRNLTRRVEELNAKVEMLRPRVTQATADGEEKPAATPRAVKNPTKAV